MKKVLAILGLTALSFAAHATDTTYNYRIPQKDIRAQVAYGQIEVFADNAGSDVYVLKTNGTLWSAGKNAFGQHGTGDISQHTVFTKATQLSGIQEIYPFSANLIAKKADGTWWGVGKNYYGELGLGDRSPRTVFTPLPGFAGASQIIKGASNTILLKKSDGWYATGYNWNNVLGLPGGAPPAMAIAPTRTLFFDDTKKIVAQGQDFIVQKTDGTWWVAGNNNSGRLGLGNTSLPAPGYTRVTALDSAVDVSMPFNRTFAKFVDGSVKAAGENGNGELGLGDSTSRSSFTPVPALAGATDFRSQDQAVFAKLGNGSWVSSGRAGFKLNADWGAVGSFRAANIPANTVQLKTMKTTVIALGSDGKISVWGYNTYGELGLGNTSMQVGAGENLFPGPSF